MKLGVPILIALALAAGCSKPVALGAETQAGPFKVTLKAEPNPPTAGTVTFEAIVTKDGQPVEDVAIGADIGPKGGSTTKIQFKTISGQHFGDYTVSPGKWEITITLLSAGKIGSAKYEFEVQ